MNNVNSGQEISSNGKVYEILSTVLLFVGPLVVILLATVGYVIAEPAAKVWFGFLMLYSVLCLVLGIMSLQYPFRIGKYGFLMTVAVMHISALMLVFAMYTAYRPG